MDERRLTELFRDAADDAASQAPPATFDHGDVMAGSRRAALRQRRRVAGGVAVAAVALAAAGLAGAGVLGSPGGTSSTLAGPAPASTAPRPEFAPQARSAGPPEAAPYGAASRSGGPAGAAEAPRPRQATPFGAQKRDAPAGCANPDAGLFAQLTAVLPTVKGASPRPPSDAARCPQGARGVEVDVDDAGARGVLRVIVAPAGADPRATGVAGPGSVTRSARTRDGGQLTVTSVPAGGGGAPFAARLDRITADLAGRL